jgi:hypothetical protein
MLRRFAPGLLFVALCTGSLLLGSFGFAHAQSEQDEIATPECNCGHRRPPAVAGTYSGPVDDNTNRRGTLTLSVVQKGKRITGAWSLSYPSDAGVSGRFVGKVFQRAIQAKMSTSIKGCRYLVTATIFQGAFQGNFMTSGRCPEEDSGAFQIGIQ